MAPFSKIQSLRLDRWLWFSRIISSRSKAGALIIQGKVRVNRAKVFKPSHIIRVDDVITASLSQGIKVVIVRGLVDRRISAKYAQNLFQELTNRKALDQTDS